MEFAKYNIDIAALCETRFLESGSLNDLEYLLEARVGFALKKGYRHKADRNATASK